MQQLLQQAAAQGIAPAYVARLLAAFPAGEQGSSPSTSSGTGAEEQTGLSNREIAEELYLSVNTIKWYGSQIFGKLGVKKRAEAIDRARELGILG